MVAGDPEPKTRSVEEDPVLSSFMGFLAADMQSSPEHSTPVDGDVLNRISTLVREVRTSPKEDLGDEALI